jgi:predicted phage terminase large subunit-like protein
MNPENFSAAQRVATLNPEQKKELLSSLSPAEQEVLRSYWPFWARPQQLPPEGQWSVWLYMAGRGAGKALALDTPLPTPTGWTTMGKVRVGDRLFDEAGQPCSVLYVTEFQYDRQCYEIRFDDGTTIVADADHRWLTWDKAARKSHGRAKNPTRHPSVRTTEQIKNSLRVGRRSETNHSVPVAGALRLPETDLPVDPYVLGYWLGDGSSAEASVTLGDADAAEVLAEFERRGVKVTGPVRRKPDANCGVYPIGGAPPLRNNGRFESANGLYSQLKKLNVVKNKHVPAVYLRASERQRRELLAGLMDSDGGWSRGTVEYCSTNRVLAQGVHELALSLGYKATLREGRATLYGRDCGPRYRVCWTPRDSLFKLARKNIVRKGLQQGAVLKHRYIVDVRPVESVPVRCIQVDSPSHLFLAGRAMVPTHNTRAGAEWAKNRCETLQVEGGVPRGAFVAPTLENVRLVMVEGESGILRCLPPSLLVKGSVEDSWNRVACELTLANGAKVKGFSAEKAGRLRGPQHHFVWLDEPAEFRDAHLGLKEDTTFAMALIGCRLPPDPRLMATGTPKNVRLIHDLLNDPSTVVTRGTTYDNLMNLGDEYRERILTRYEGTRLGRQELMAELLNDAGAIFSRQWFPITSKPLQGPHVRRIRAWDLAATEPSDGNPDPDWTAGALLAWDGTKMIEDSDVPGVLQIQHIVRWRKGPGATQDGVLRQTQLDAFPRVLIEREPGSAGKALVAAYSRALSGLARLEGIAPSGDKETRAEIWSLLAEQGRVSLLAGDWNADFLDELEEFPVGAHDDQIDAVSVAAGWLTGRRTARRRNKILQARLELPKSVVSSRPVARLR